MHSLARLFHVSIYGMMLLSSLMLAHAEGAVFPVVISAPLVVLAWICTERYSVMRLPLWGSNLLGAAAFGLALLELFGNSLEGRLLSGAHLLVYLSWVVLFQKKTVRHYWWMCALSVLQVAVGAVLTTSPLYGLLLFLYFCGTIWTLSLFSLWQHEVDASEGEQEPVLPPSSTAEGALQPGAVSAVHPSRHATNPFELLRKPSQAKNSIQLDPGERWMGMRFLFGTSVTAGCSMALAILFFLLTPRLWLGTASFGGEATPGPTRSLTGFTEKVRLGDIGRIMESTEPVLMMKLFNNQTNEELSVEEYAMKAGMGEPLFRGAVLAFYDHGDWSGGSISGRLETIRDRVSDDARRLRQEITLQPIGTDILMAMHPALEARMRGGGKEIGRFRFSSVLAIADRTKPRVPVNYYVYLPVLGAADADSFRMAGLPPQIRSAVHKRYTQLPEKGLERLIASAERVAGIEAGKPRPDEKEMARKIVHWLRDSGEFHYSLDAKVINFELDPVEDFLINRREGHCEYYASALALMLRAVGIPSRLVSGFKGGKVNRITGDFEVEQRHAHAWVEALFDEGWETLDATPSEARTESVASLEPELTTLYDFRTFAREAWSQYVVNMNIFQQRDRFYAPLQSTWDSITGLLLGDDKIDGVSGFFGQIGALFTSTPGKGNPVGWKRGAVLFVLLCFVAVAAALVRYAWILARKLRSNTRAARAAARRVEFYEKFRRICSAAGMSREGGQTQREFGQSVQSVWNGELKGTDLIQAPGDLTELFYRVRFGQEELEPEEMAAIDRLVTMLEARILPDGKRRR